VDRLKVLFHQKLAAVDGRDACQSASVAAENTEYSRVLPSIRPGMTSCNNYNFTVTGAPRPLQKDLFQTVLQLASFECFIVRLEIQDSLQLMCSFL